MAQCEIVRASDGFLAPSVIELIRESELFNDYSQPVDKSFAMLFKKTTKKTIEPEAAAETKPKLRPKIWFGIGAKLIALVGFVLLASIVSLVWMNSRMFVEHATVTLNKMNSDMASSIAGQMREVFVNVTDKMRVMGGVLVQNTSAQTMTLEKEKLLASSFFEKDKEFLALFVIELDASSPVGVRASSRLVSPELANWNDANGDELLNSTLSSPELGLKAIFQNDISLGLIPVSEGGFAVVVGVPLVAGSTEGTFTHGVISVVKHQRFEAPFQESSQITSFLTDRRGRLLAHSDLSKANLGESMAATEVVKQMLTGKFNNGQTRYEDPVTREIKLGAYRTVGFSGVGVVAEVLEAEAFELSSQIKNRAILLAAGILFTAFLFAYWYSKSLTSPIEKLVDAARLISEGNFKIRLTPKSRDEISHLALTFNEMAAGLEERDRVKETFNKFHNKEIAEKLLAGEVKLGGERLVATIFFSDVRGFTALSESMQPEQVVEMLNEYMTRMVSVIRANGGIVDKYVGDAIMALWGVPFAKPDDSKRALKACLEMREELAKLNELRISRGQGALKIGMGLNRGDVIAGNIGSNEKMEYTVIGDAVNLGSRIESMTKEYGTDLLISESIYSETHESFVFEKSHATKVKGKSEAIQVYKVRGYVDQDGKEVLIETAYSSYAAEKSDKVVHENPAPAAADTATMAEVDTITEVGKMTETSTVSLEPEVSVDEIQAPVFVADELPAEEVVSDETPGDLAEELSVSHSAVVSPGPQQLQFRGIVLEELEDLESLKKSDRAA